METAYSLLGTGEGNEVAAAEPVSNLVDDDGNQLKELAMRYKIAFAFFLPCADGGAGSNEVWAFGTVGAWVKTTNEVIFRQGFSFFRVGRGDFWYAGVTFPAVRASRG